MFPLTQVVRYYKPPRIVFGVNAVDNLGKYAREMGLAGRAAIITDAGVAKAGIPARVVEALQKSGIEAAVFDQGRPEPDDAVCDQAADFVRREGADFVIGLGGGSAMDIAKVAAQLAVVGGSTEEHLRKTSFPRKGLPLIAVPTTAGTGAECTMFAIINLPREGIKGFFFTPLIIPDLAVVDPTLTLTMPPGVTASSGADALAHAIETMMARKENPLTDALAFKAVELIAEALLVAVYDGSNLEARVKMSYASMMAGLAFNDTGIIEGHALAHALGSFYHIPHGLACAVALPFAMEYNMGHCLEKLARMAAVLGQHASGMSTRQAALAAIHAVRQLLADAGLPTDWSRWGRKEDIPALAEMMVKSPWITAFYGYAKRPMSEDAAAELLRRSYEGRIGEGPY